MFSKRRTEIFVHENISFYPVTSTAFVESMVTAQGVFCGAGFQTPSEALFLKKKLLVIPMKGQYEQQGNAVALKLLGIPVMALSRMVLGVHYPTDVLAGTILGAATAEAVHKIERATA